MFEVTHFHFPLQNVELVSPLASRQPVPGTDMSMCPPRSFGWSTSQRGWQSPQQDCRIQVIQFRDQSFYQRKQRLESLFLLQQEDLLWWERRDSQHGPYESLHLAFRKQTPTLLSEHPELSCHRILAFGDEHLLVMVSAHYPATLPPKAEAEIVAAIQSVTYHPHGVVSDWPSFAGFTLDFETAGLNWTPTPQLSPRGPFLLESHPQSSHPGMRVIVENKEGLPESPGSSLEALFQRNFFSSYQVLEIQPFRLRNLAGFEAFAIESSPEQATARLEYVAILLLDNDHLSFTCLAPDDRISHLSTFRRLVQSYQPA